MEIGEHGLLQRARSARQDKAHKDSVKE